MDKLTAVFEHDGDWWIGWVEEVPGANVQERTIEEAQESLKEAVFLILETNRNVARRDAEGRNVMREELLLGTT